MNQTPAERIRAANRILLSEGNPEVVSEFFAADYVAHMTGRDLKGGAAFVRNYIEALLRAFSDISVAVEILVEAGDRVSWQRTLSATHTGSFQGFPATGSPIVWRDMVTSRFKEGLIAEDWPISDLAEQLLRAR